MNHTDTALLGRLTDRDLAILDDLEQFRLLTTRLIQRLHFPVAPDHHATIGSATKATMRVLTRLQHHGLVAHLARRIGGVRHGSQGYIWQLAATGERIQRHRRGQPGRRRYTEPSSALFTDHTLAVAELATTIRTLALDGALEILALASEPACWRQFPGPHGVAQTLKPDLYAVTATSAWEDHWFIEADRGTEHIPKILAKCRVYAAYAATGTEQHRSGVLPAVLWVTPDAERADVLTRAVSAEQALPDGLFAVICAEQFVTHLTTGEVTS